jgi:hypothetical protein
MKAALLIERLDKDFRVLERRELSSKSFVKNFLSLLYVMHAQLSNGAPHSMPDITNTARNIDAYDTTGRSGKGNLRVGSSGGGGTAQVATPSSASSWTYDSIENEKLGVVVGTGLNVVTPTDYALQTQVAHGRAAGQLEYSGGGVRNLLIAAPNVTMNIVRYFENHSGGDITINECGIYAAGCSYNGQANHYAWSFCIARDLLGAPVVVADTELLRVTYTPTTTV